MKEIYDWVPWFTELSRKIAAGDPKELVDRARQVTWSDKEKDPPTMIRSVGPDPFTFIYYIAARSTTFAARRIIYPSISKIFDIEMFEDKDSEHTCIFPTPMPLIARFNMNDSRNLPLLWDLFCSAVKGTSSMPTENATDAGQWRSCIRRQCNSQTRYATVSWAVQTSTMASR